MFRSCRVEPIQVVSCRSFLHQIGKTVISALFRCNLDKKTGMVFILLSAAFLNIQNAPGMKVSMKHGRICIELLRNNYLFWATLMCFQRDTYVVHWSS